MDEITIDSNSLSGKNTFNVDESDLQKLQIRFDGLSGAMKSFESLSEINFPRLNLLQEEESFTKLFEFDIEKEAGQKFIDSKEFNACPFCM